MSSRLLRSQDFWTGCAFTAFGVTTVALAQAYPMGTTARMGPGYFPTALGILLAVIGLIILVKSSIAAQGDEIGRVDGWLLLRILLSVAAFALLLNPLGLVLAAMTVVLVAAWAGHEFRLGEALINAVVLALLSYLLFVWGLGQTMPVWPWFLAT
jgi:hypothetical protein